MVELGRFDTVPTVRSMTAGAVGAEAAFMCISMAVGALRKRDRLELSIFRVIGAFIILYQDMAFITRDGFMFAR